MKKIVILLALLLLSSSTIYAIEDNSSKEIDKDVEEEILFEDTTNVIFGEVSKKEIYSLNNYSTPIQSSGASVDVITREDIQNQNTPEISKLLNETMGVSYGQGSGGYGMPSTLMIRGSNRVLFNVDGIRIDNPASTARTTDLSNYLMSDDIERLEVIRGPQGTIAGHTATGGMIAARTRRGSGKLQTEAESLFGSYGYFKERFAIMGGGEKFDHYTSINWFKTDDGTKIEKVGRYGNNQYNNLGLTGNYGLRFLDGKAELRNIVKYNRGRKNLGMNYYSIGQNQPRFSDKDYALTQDFSNSLTWAHNVNSRYNYDLRTTVYNRNYRMHYVNSPGELFGSDYMFQTNSARFNLGTQHNFDLADWNTLSAGYNFEVENYRYHTGGDWSNYMRNHTYQNDVYLQDSINIKDTLFVRGGARYSTHSAFGNWISPNASAALVLPTFKLKEAKTTFRGSWGMNRNTPTLYQRFGDGIEIGPWGYASNGGMILGNPDLKAERVQSWDAGINQSFFNGKLAFDFGYFEQNSRDYIAYTMNEYWIGKYQNIDKARIHGYEGKATWAPNEKVKFVVNYTYTDAKDQTNDQLLPLVSKNRVNGTIILTPIERISTYFGLESGSERYMGDGTNKTLPGYVDANIGTNIRLFTKNNVSAYLKGDIYNLFNQKLTCGYAGPYRIYKPGINFRVGLYLKYNLPEKDKDVL
ncbi:TonB-dependent receptor [bacterium]|nr:TonB-dependent receptor [bacterium]